ncbi:hypothetical protein [Ancylobacter sp.]|uniref:hypothetical protein n=1 Tax=Ancylobacter sp. TaxID=1872567 RepID=UPI003D09E04C
MRTSSPSFARVLLGAVLAFALAGCPGEREPERRERVATPAGDSVAGKTWLQPTDDTAPELWLASREAGGDVTVTDPATKNWRGILDEVDGRFGESDRMIANRAVQLETMLSEIGIRESAREIIADFSGLAAKGSRAGFSDLCQHYYNLRVQGRDRAAALAALRGESVSTTGAATP